MERRGKGDVGFQFVPRGDGTWKDEIMAGEMREGTRRGTF